MWIPVIASRQLKRQPVRVIYWGSPVAIFRTVSGQLGALEDRCAHRAVPLSRGSVQGESIRCDYHHYAYDSRGSCVSTPAFMLVNGADRATCTVRPFSIREEQGLIWLSVEAGAPFPVPPHWRAERWNVGSNFRTLRGSIRGWLDHYLDVGHLLFNHFRTVYTGDGETIPELAYEPSVESNGNYPFNAGRLRLRNASLRSMLLAYSQARTPLRFLAGALQAGSVVRTIEIAGQMLSPACQMLELRYLSSFGQCGIEALTFLNPIGRDEQVFCTLAAISPSLHWPMTRFQRNHLLRIIADRHIVGEDSPFVEGITEFDLAHYHLSPRDAPLVLMRQLLSRYLAEKAGLFPLSSLLHELK